MASQAVVVAMEFEWRCMDRNLAGREPSPQPAALSAFLAVESRESSTHVAASFTAERAAGDGWAIEPLRDAASHPCSKRASAFNLAVIS
jgi:hypothetical protein